MAKRTKPAVFMNEPTELFKLAFAKRYPDFDPSNDIWIRRLKDAFVLEYVLGDDKYERGGWQILMNDILKKKAQRGECIYENY